MMLFQIVAANRWRLFRPFCLAVIFSFIICYYYMDYIMDYAVYEEHAITQGFFVNTSGCHMVALNPIPIESLVNDEELPSLQCQKPELLHGEVVDGRNYLVWSMTEDNIRSVFQVRNVSDINCYYVGISRYSDNKNNYDDRKSFRLNSMRTKQLLDEDVKIVRVECIRDGNETIYHDVHFFLPTAEVTGVQDKRISVMILGIDSISHMHYLRSMPQFQSFIENADLPHVEFWGYNRVGRNSYPNLVPLLSGMSDAELEANCSKNGDEHYDRCPIIWKQFKAAGYYTSLGEDHIGGCFNYVKKGFYSQPTDYILRPVLFEMNQNTRYSCDKQELVHCSGHRLFSEVLQEFIFKLVPHMKQHPFFSFFWRAMGVHDYATYAKTVDMEYVKMLRSLQTQGILNRSLILFMSDHGLRFTGFRKSYQGMQEESQPLLIAFYPKWFGTLYPEAIINLKRNAHSLVTTFDLHETLKDILHPKQLLREQLVKRTVALKSLGRNAPRGVSLFLPIPKQRDCNMAGIPTHYCLCHKLNEISIEDSRAKRAARFIVRSLNALLSSYPQCHRLELEQVLAAYLLEQPMDPNAYEVRVRLVTEPGGGLFEGTTRFLGFKVALDGVVTRSNAYRNQSYCVNNYRIEMYCYCKH